MKASTPPALASWLLEHSGADAAIVGDIVEEYAKGQTPVWLWKQVIVAASPAAVRGLRWLAVMPLTLSALAIEFWIVAIGGGRGPLLWVMLVPAMFIMAVTFVKMSASVAPSRKDSVRRIALSVVIICGGFFAIMDMLLGLGFRGYDSLLGACVVLGGALGYVSSSELKTVFWREISLCWLGGLTRPPI